MEQKRKPYAIRVSDAEINAIKDIAKASGQTVTNVMLQGAQLTAQNLDLQHEIESLKKEQAAMNARFAELTGHKPQKRQKRIIVPVSDIEHQAIKALAFERDVSMGSVIRQELSVMLQAASSKPELQIIR